ncbi:MAG: hypothetical protein ACYC67_21400 [Prosthecobacter sp.]
MQRAFHLIGYLLLIAALPAVVENMWEVYWATITVGPQMIGFVLAHADPDSSWMRVIRYSGLAGIAYHLFGVITVGRILLGLKPNRHVKLFSWMFLIFTVHGIIAAFYSFWSPWFERT